MISEISHKITYSLEKNKVIDKEDEDIYIYGIEILISSMITFIIVLILGLLFKCLLASLTYFIIFATIRQICGGYHAATYLKCNTIFTFTTVIVLLAYKFVPVDMLGFLHYLIMSFWVLTVFIFAPVENESKPISKEKKYKLKIIGRIMSIIITIISCLIYIKEIQYAVLLDVTLLFIAFAMAVVGFREKGSEQDEKNC